MTTLSTIDNEPLRCHLSHDECQRELSTLRYKQVIPFSLVPAVMQPALRKWLKTKGITDHGEVSNYNYCEWYYHVLANGPGYPIQFRVQ